MKKQEVVSLTATAAALALLSGCTSPGSDIPSMADMLHETTGQNGRACVRQADMRGYGILKNRVVSIDGRRSYYLATVRPGCNDLQTSARAIFSGEFTEVCGQRMDQIVTGGDQCTIGQIFEFENRETAFETYNTILERREQLRQEAQE